LLGSGLGLIAAQLAACGRSPEVMNLPEAARKSVFQKKVDVEHRSAKSSRSGQGFPKRRSTSQQPGTSQTQRAFHEPAS
jgi:hypothetical protein